MKTIKDKITKERPKYIKEFQHIKMELVHHLKETLFFSIYLAAPLIFVSVLVSSSLDKLNMGLIAISYAMFFLGGMLPDYLRLLGILLENRGLCDYSHHKIIMLFALIFSILFYFQFLELANLVIVNLFFLLGISIHLRSDRFEEYTELKGKRIVREPISEIFRSIISFLKKKDK